MLRSTSRVRPAGAACKASWLLWMWTVDLRVTWSTAGPTGLRPGASSSRARLVVLCMLRRQANAEGGRERFSLGLKNLGRSRAQCATEGTHLERTAGSVDLFFCADKSVGGQRRELIRCKARRRRARRRWLWLAPRRRGAACQRGPHPTRRPHPQASPWHMGVVQWWSPGWVGGLGRRVSYDLAASWRLGSEAVLDVPHVRTSWLARWLHVVDLLVISWVGAS
jgi:hypothetical protein